jgi:hypothetical protein
VQSYQRGHIGGVYGSVVSLAALAYFIVVGLRNDHVNWAAIAISLIVLGVSARGVYKFRRVKPCNLAK